MKGWGQDGKVGSPWGHFLTWAQKNYKYLKRNFGEEDQKIAEKEIPQL